jgi:hypothetical protein
MTIAKSRAREALGQSSAEAECACNSGWWGCDHDVGVREPAGSRGMWIVV